MAGCLYPASPGIEPCAMGGGAGDLSPGSRGQANAGALRRGRRRVSGGWDGQRLQQLLANLAKAHRGWDQRAVERDRNRVCGTPTAPQLTFMVRSAPMSAFGEQRQMMHIGGLIGRRAERRDPS
jgi:hypothetical protein